MSLEKVYTVKPKPYDVLWVFKFDLNGVLTSFQIQDGNFDPAQYEWLIKKSFFPATEEHIKGWTKTYPNFFEITVGEIDLSFDTFWNTYANKVGKKIQAERTWNKLSKKDKLKALSSIKSYQNYLKRNQGIAKAYPNTYLNQRYFDNDYKSTA